MTTEPTYGDNNILSVAVDVERVMKATHVPYCFIGGVAVQRWGLPRQTVDVDLAVFAGFGAESAIVERLIRSFQPRIDDVMNFARQYRVVLLQSDSGVGINVSLAAIPFEARMIERSTPWIVPRHGAIRTCAAEDLVVMKAVAGRPQDWIDIESVIVRNAAVLNRELALREFAGFAEVDELTQSLQLLKQLLNKHPAAETGSE